MGDSATLAKARQELEDLYLGIPDASVDLTFKDMTNIQQNDVAERKTTTNKAPIHQDPHKDLKTAINDLTKSPSLDFSKALQGAKPHDRRTIEDELYREHYARSNVKRTGNGLRPLNVESSLVYDDASAISTLSPLEEKGGKKRTGIPHSNICPLCNKCIYFFRHRCLVCGRVYCRNCVGKGMGEMTEGRKCVDCLGRRFSPRYIHRAGKTGCWGRYSGFVKQQELMWAEKGPRKRGERRYNEKSSRNSVVMPATPRKSYVVPGTPNRFADNNYNSNPSSFIASSTFSPNPHNFPL
ncbi:uncharacterized protein LOC109849604 [Asparagus officinalis]|uniref:uncharacterized protein LOC109849604 n=1 Tax=Asparagus officinalis TaxID=4686 RepID=UPI00098E21C0|nr:uncharacterized protein LOC109849604 [Asparagus officinalis]